MSAGFYGRLVGGTPSDNFRLFSRQSVFRLYRERHKLPVTVAEMRSLLAIRLPKIVTEPGKWNSGKKMPRNAFLLSKSHSYQLGSSWDWMVVEARGNAERFRALIAFDKTKQQYRAWLGHVRGHDMALLARLEFHPSHRGWHCHWKNGDLSSVVRGVVKDSKLRDRVRECDDPVFTVSHLNAQTIAFRAFNIHPSTPPDVLI